MPRYRVDKDALEKLGGAGGRRSRRKVSPGDVRAHRQKVEKPAGLAAWLGPRIGGPGLAGAVGLAGLAVGWDWLTLGAAVVFAAALGSGAGYGLTYWLLVRAMADFAREKEEITEDVIVNGPPVVAADHVSVESNGRIQFFPSNAVDPLSWGPYDFTREQTAALRAAARSEDGQITAGVIGMGSNRARYKEFTDWGQEWGYLEKRGRYYFLTSAGRRAVLAPPSPTNTKDSN